MVKKLDIRIENVQEAYDGPIGILWEMLMGDQIHIGGAKETDILAKKAGIKKDSHVLDVCSAVGGPARYLTRNYGCKVTGLDATPTMISEAIKRTKGTGLEDLLEFKLGNALDMPFRANTFDVVWGQDAWCYITDKNRLIAECHRVLKPKGTIAFTDWLMSKNASEEELEAYNTFMIFPYMETLDGYANLLENNGFEVVEKEDLGEQFRSYMHVYRDKFRNELKNAVIQAYGQEMFDTADEGIAICVKAADDGKATRGRLIGRKR
ncbi:MAG: class I SAM-dependent methyltransferase [Candidatus Methanofastidiosia archaeon]